MALFVRECGASSFLPMLFSLANKPLETYVILLIFVLYDHRMPILSVPLSYVWFCTLKGVCVQCYFREYMLFVEGGEPEPGGSYT